MEPTASLGEQLYWLASLFDPFCGPLGFLNLLPDGSLLSCGDTGWGDEVARGFFVTITLALCTLPIGLVIGLFLALAKQTEVRSLRTAANIYTTIFPRSARTADDLHDLFRPADRGARSGHCTGL
jgi:polar amino acid transport system permease protein